MLIKKLAMFVMAVLLLGACGSKADDKKEEAKPATTEEKTDDTKAVEADAEPKEEEKESAEKEDDGSVLNPYIAEDLDADVKVVYTNKNPGLKHAYSDKVTMEIDEYQIVHVSNMNESSKTNFDGEDEGYVLTYKMTLDNKSDEDVFYAGGVTLLADNGVDYIIPRQHLVDRDQWLKDESTKDASQYSKGKSFTGMNAHSMTKAQFEKLSSPTLRIDALWLNNDTSKRLGEDAVFKLPFNDKGAEKAAASGELYQDKMVTDNIADKEIFFENTEINETKEIDGVKITLNGVQYADVTPTDGHAERFSNFGDSGLVALTVKMTIENGSDTPFDKFLVDRKLTIDGDRGTMFNQGMLEPNYSGTSNPGNKDEFLTVFLFRKDEFDIFKKFDMQVGPLKDENAKELFKEKSVTFELPVKE
ncbi:DUF5068 domain-containing protein [Siminovitchia fortis]|uniref:DUF5068 domain-containing protein n=1 Tax=Siminovitchia fortis TaxID=254758 RepID=A0A443IUW3_9BACI|nr:DUF5068 domain-containing protein [Siminovitchia fortis]RWR11875.1 DUF5068 domain-containing protein [Siminovitchia fortis]WHY81844.1 DUF5068 domain-containing protein [Siminovitchia fortis]